MIAPGTLRSLAFACVIPAALAGCAIQAPVSVVPQTYDFGPQAVHARTKPAIPGTLLITPVRSPAALDHGGIVYRLLYEDGARPRIYATNRWAADPAALLTDRLRSRFAAAAAEGVVAPGYSVRSDHTLRVELDDFSQHFQAPGQARVLVRARATLLSSQDRRLLAQRVFDVERASPGNAQGAVKALTEAADALIEELVTWAAENVRLKP